MSPHLWIVEVFPETAPMHALRWSSACLPSRGTFMPRTIIWWVLTRIIDLPRGRHVILLLSVRRTVMTMLLYNDDSLI